MSNLRLINQTTVSSSVGFVNVENVFSADYDIYKIVGSNFSTASTTATESYLRYINSSGSVISSDYEFASYYMPADATFSDIRTDNTGDSTKIHYAMGNADQEGEYAGGVLYIFNPFNSSCYTLDTSQQISHYSNPRLLATKGFGVLKQNSSITGFQFMFPSSDVSSGVINTFGLRVDS